MASGSSPGGSGGMKGGRSGTELAVWVVGAAFVFIAVLRAVLILARVGDDPAFTAAFNSLAAALVVAVGAYRVARP